MVSYGQTDMHLTKFSCRQSMICCRLLLYRVFGIIVFMILVPPPQHATIVYLIQTLYIATWRISCQMCIVCKHGLFTSYRCYGKDLTISLAMMYDLLSPQELM